MRFGTFYAPIYVKYNEFVGNIMAAAGLEQMTISVGEADRGKKQSLSTTKNHGSSEFADLIKDRPKLVYSAVTKTDPAQKASKNSQDRQKISEGESLKPKIIDLNKKMEEEAGVALESMLLVAPISQIEAVPLCEEGEFVDFTSEDEEILKQELGEESREGFEEELVVPVLNTVTSVEGDISKIITKPELVISESSAVANIRGVSGLIEGSDKVKENVVVGAPLVIAELSPQEQSLIQNMKSFKLPEGFGNDFGKSNKNINITQKDPINQSVLGERPFVQNSEILLKSATFKTIEQTKASSFIVNDDVSRLISISSNLLLADETRQGQSVLAKMNSSLVSEFKMSSITQGEIKLNLENQSNFADLEQDTREFGSKEHSVVDFSGGTLEVNSEDLFQVSFRENALEPKTELPKPAMQVSLAVKEVLSVSSNVGKKEITINLFPEVLGPIKVEILSVLGESGARKIESIKITAEKRETLEILEKSRMDLEKSLKEVTSTKEEASLQFEMNHQGKGSSGAYFDSLEERDSWMRNFASLIEKEEPIDGIKENEGQNSGYITADSINIKV